MTTLDTETLRQLHSRILEAPHDDTPRLLYADELMELDTPESVARAEFIRVQCRSAHLKSADGGKHANHAEASKNCMLCYEVERLQNRERELFNGNYDRWFPVPPRYGFDWAINLLAKDADERPNYVVRRGFVSSVRCRLADWVGAPCENCEGYGTVEDGRYENVLHGCPNCGGEDEIDDESGRLICSPGTGRTHAHGPRIVAEQPVESLSPTCREPLEFEGRWLWHNAEHRLMSSDYDGDTRPPDHLPAILFDALTGFHERTNPMARQMVKAYGEHRTAMKALSRVTPLLLNWARREAGLPPLEDRR